jgi:mono/diheme cytochrome c family protein
MAPVNRAALAGVAAALAAPLFGCRIESTFVKPDPHLERMLKQEKAVPYDDNPILPNGMVMQHPPDGTLPVDAIAGDPLLATGAAQGHWATTYPRHVDRAAVESGGQRFDVFCAPCHGVLGDGVSIVSEKMTLRKPPSLLEPRIRAYPVGRIFQTIRGGYGLMPAYAVQISVTDAWAVTAYVRALQIARGVRVGDLSPDLRVEHARQAP